MNALLPSSILFAGLLASSAAHAQSAPGATAPQANLVAEQSVAQPVNSVNLSPLGLLIGGYNLNYERLLGGYHGVLVESSFVSNSTTSTFGGSLGYRFHWRGKQDSGFVGVNLGHSRGTAEASKEGATQVHDVDLVASSLTVNVGRRWAWESGLNITFRIGAGRGSYEATTDSTDLEAKEAAAELSSLSVAFDSELSLGYNF